MGLETNLETSLGGKPAHHQKAIPTAHLTFVIDCSWGTALLDTPPGLPRAPSSNLGPVIPPVKTYIFLCEESQSHLTPESLLDGGHLGQARGTLPSRKGTVAPALHPSQHTLIPGGSSSQRRHWRLCLWGLQLGKQSQSHSKPSPPLSVGRQINWKSLTMGMGVGMPGYSVQGLQFPEPTPSSPPSRHLLSQGRSVRFTKGHVKHTLRTYSRVPYFLLPLLSLLAFQQKQGKAHPHAKCQGRHHSYVRSSYCWNGGWVRAGEKGSTTK